MFVDVSDRIKAGIIMHLSASPRLNQFLPEARIFAMQVPANVGYPYFRYGAPIVTPYFASCFQGSTVRATFDLFAQGGPGTEAGETQAGFLLGLVVEAMNDLQLGSLSLVDNTYLGSRITNVDQEADRWRAMLEYNITAVL